MQQNRRFLGLLIAFFVPFSLFAQTLMQPLRGLNAGVMKEAGLTGKGVKVGVIDAGFFNADSSKKLAKFYEEGRVKQAHDFVEEKIVNFYYLNKETHGREVMEYIGGVDGVQKGIAPDVSFYLARTEFPDKDYWKEEEFLEQALAEMYQKGVRLVNISLGYALDHADKKENYKPAQMDGKTSIAVRACQKYAEKGMIIVVAAGNEGGDKKWRVISTPADAKDVISVGAVGNHKLLNSILMMAKGEEVPTSLMSKASYSSIGPTQLTYLKPEISAHSELGTSFAAPAITGLIACMLQVDSTLSPQKVKEILQKAGSFYPCPNNYVGYGVPDAQKVLELLQDDKSAMGNVIERTIALNHFSLITREQTATIYEKSADAIVKKMKVIKIKKDELKVKRKRGIVRTTVVVGKEMYELKWVK
ncbi:MAG: S8 family serine peptidase [Bacteroidia bacterium]